MLAVALLDTARWSEGPGLILFECDPMHPCGPLSLEAFFLQRRTRHHLKIFLLLLSLS